MLVSIVGRWIAREPVVPPRTSTRSVPDSAAQVDAEPVPAATVVTAAEPPVAMRSDPSPTADADAAFERPRVWNRDWQIPESAGADSAGDRFVALEPATAVATIERGEVAAFAPSGVAAFESNDVAAFEPTEAVSRPEHSEPAAPEPSRRVRSDGRT